MTATEEFVTKFHNLDGKTIGEKRKNLFLLLNTTNPNDIDFAQIRPQNLLEEKFKVDLLLHFKRLTDLIEILQSERNLQIQRILKRSRWFVEQVVSSISADELTKVIFPNVSFRTKVKLINKLAIYLNDSDKAHEYFEAINKQYGAYLASKLLPSCSIDHILNFLRTRHFKPTPKQVLTIIKRHPEFSEEIVDIVIQFNDAREEYVNVFDYLKMHDLNLLWVLNRKHGLGLRLGWRTTDKYVQEHKEEIISQPKRYYKTLHNKQIAKSLYFKFDALYRNLFPQDLDAFNREYRILFTVLKDLPKKIRKVALLVDNFEKIYGTSFWMSSYWGIDILDLLNDDERESALNMGKKPKHVLEAKWNSYLKTDKSVPLLKKEISLSSDVKTRAVLVECLVNTCKINMDDVALLDVSNYVLKTHRNDHIKVRRMFLIAIRANYNLEKLSEDVWKCIQELLGIFELNGESYEHMAEYKKAYMRYKVLRGESLENELTQWIREKNQDLIIFEKEQMQVHCFKVFDDAISKELRGDDLIDFHLNLLRSAISWNKVNNDKIPLLSLKSAIQCLKEKFATNNINHGDVRVLCILIEEECKNSTDKEMLKIYLNSEVYGDTNILMWLIRNDHNAVKENIEIITKIFLRCFHWSYREYYFFRYAKNYPEIADTIVAILLRNPKETGAMISLSTMQKPDGFIKIVEEYYPTEVQANSKTEESRALYAIQETATRCLKNLDPQSASMSSILKFCKGDYLKLIRTALYSVCDNSNEIKVIPFLSELIDQAVSIRKHALHLTFRVLDKRQVYSLIKHFMEKEKNDSIRKFIFKGCFNFFVKNPDDFTWELVVLNLNSVDINDTEAVEVLLQFDKVPKEYRNKYVVLAWDVLNKVPDPNNTKNGNISNLLKHVSEDLIPVLPQEFYDKVIRDYFLKDDPSNLSFFGSCVNAFVCKHILYSRSFLEKKQRLETCFAIVKDYVLRSGVKAVACNPVIDFLKEFCLPFLKDLCEDKEILEEFVGLWNGFLQPFEAFNEFLHLKFVDFYLERLDVGELGTRLGELCDTLVETYGDAIVGIIANKIIFFERYFLRTSEDEDRYDLIEGIISSGSTACLIVAIFLLSNNNPDEKRTKRRYHEIIKKLEEEDSPTIRLYLCSLINKTVGLYFSNC